MFCPSLCHCGDHRSKGNWFGKRWKTLVAGGGVLVTLSGGLVAVGKPLKGKIYAGKFDATDFIYVQDGMECELAGDKPTQTPLKCIEGNHNQNSIYIFGNSHASNLVPSANLATSVNNYDEVKYLTNASAERMGGKDWHKNTDVHRILNKTTESDLIIWSHSQINPGNQSSKVSVISQIEYLSELSTRTGVKILIVDDLPDFGGEQNFLPRFTLQQDGPTVKEAVARQNRSFHTNLVKSIIKSPSIFYLDPLDVLCRAGTCGAVIDGKLVYADSSPHFNKEGTIILSNKILRIRNR